MSQTISKKEFLAILGAKITTTKSRKQEDTGDKLPASAACASIETQLVQIKDALHKGNKAKLRDLCAGIGVELYEILQQAEQQ